MATGCYNADTVYLPGSFRGVAFKAMDVSSEHGRRAATAEFAFGEDTSYADMGRKLRKYNIRARFDSNLHNLEASALIAAAETSGPGVLVHPTRGVIQSAACVSLKVTDKPEEEQGVTYVDLQFCEANEFPNNLQLSGNLLGLVINPVITAARSAFLTNYDPLAIQSFRVDDVVTAAQVQVANIVVEYAAATIATLANDNQRNRNLYDLEAITVNDSDAAVPETMDRALALGMNAIAQNTSGSTKFETFRKLANNAAMSSTFNAPASLAENSVYNMVRVISAAYMAQGILEADEFRTGQIFEQQDIVDAVLTDEMNYAWTSNQNNLYSALSQFRTSSKAQIAEKAYNAPGLVAYDFGGSVHPLVAAYSIHGDAKRHREIEEIGSVNRFGRLGPTILGTRT